MLYKFSEYNSEHEIIKKKLEELTNDKTVRMLILNSYILLA